MGVAPPLDRERRVRRRQDHEASRTHDGQHCQSANPAPRSSQAPDDGEARVQEDESRVARQRRQAPEGTRFNCGPRALTGYCDVEPPQNPRQRGHRGDPRGVLGMAGVEATHRPRHRRRVGAPDRAPQMTCEPQQAEWAKHPHEQPVDLEAMTTAAEEEAEERDEGREGAELRLDGIRRAECDEWIPQQKSSAVNIIADQHLIRPEELEPVPDRRRGAQQQLRVRQGHQQRDRSSCAVPLPDIGQRALEGASPKCSRPTLSAVT